MKIIHLFIKIVVVILFIGVVGFGAFCWYKNGFNLWNLSKIKPAAPAIVEKNVEEKTPVAAKPENASMLDRAVSPFSQYMNEELVSPDGQWYFAGKKFFGQEPFSRNYNWRLEFVNLQGKGDRYVYLDWFERPEDGVYYDKDESIHPLGWSKDGNSVYYAEVQPLSKIVPGLPEQLSGYWAPAINVIKFDLGSSEYSYGNFETVKPAGATWNGYLLDLLAKEDRALWFEPAVTYPPCDSKDICENTSTPARLIYFKPSSNEEGNTVYEWSQDSKAKVISASLDQDPDVKRVAYVVHEDGKSDQTFLFEDNGKDKTTIKIDLVPYAKDITKNGISAPYRVIVEKTAMDLPGGLFLVVIGKNNKVMYFRFGYYHDKWEASFNKSGML